MLEPNKYTNYRTGIVNVGAVIIKVLQEKNNEKYGVVMKEVKKVAGEESKYEFQNALNFLFLLGKVTYYCDTDILELIV